MSLSFSPSHFQLTAEAPVHTVLGAALLSQREPPRLPWPRAQQLVRVLLNTCWVAFHVSPVAAGIECLAAVPHSSQSCCSRLQSVTESPQSRRSYAPAKTATASGACRRPTSAATPSNTCGCRMRSSTRSRRTPSAETVRLTLCCVRVDLSQCLEKTHELASRVRRRIVSHTDDGIVESSG